MTSEERAKEARDTRIKVLEAALKECEWANTEVDSSLKMIEECPICFSLKSNGHAKDCNLNKVLQGAAALYEKKRNPDDDPE